MYYVLFIIFCLFIIMYCFVKLKSETKVVEEPMTTDYGIRLILKHPDECVICLEPNVDYALVCTHKFHKECIYDWLGRSNVCPVCMTEV